METFPLPSHTEYKRSLREHRRHAWMCFHFISLEKLPCHRDIRRFSLCHTTSSLGFIRREASKKKGKIINFSATTFNKDIILLCVPHRGRRDFICWRSNLFEMRIFIKFPFRLNALCFWGSSSGPKETEGERERVEKFIHQSSQSDLQECEKTSLGCN